MKDPLNPSEAEIRQWAFDPSSTEPQQDWDLILSWIPYEKLYLELASEKNCPKTDYFLALLYFIIGNGVRTDFKNKKKKEINELLSMAERRYSNRRIYTWIQRSKELIENPHTLNYEDWCAGKLALEEA